MSPTSMPPGQLTGNVLFYSNPEPLAKEIHGSMGVKRMDGPFGFARVGHAVPLTVGEFPLAAFTGPVIFVGDEKLPIAVMGLNAGENMFLKDNGMFEDGIYVPAYIRRYPFVFANDERDRRGWRASIHRGRRRSACRCPAPGGCGSSAAWARC